MNEAPSLDICGDHIPEPDRSLVTWQEWVEKRNKETQILGRATKRAPVDLVMNVLEKTREKREQAITIEHAQLEKKVKNCRGVVLEPPARLKQPCDICCPVIEATQTRLDKGRPRKVEHIGVPAYIQTTEKGLTGKPKRNPCTKLNASFKNYVEQRQKELKHKIAKIDPFKPHIDDLIIIGQKPKERPKPIVLPVVSLAEEVVFPQQEDSDIYAIRINDTVIFRDDHCKNLQTVREMQAEPWHRQTTQWKYYFNAKVKKASRCNLFIQNLGTISIRFCWDQLKFSIPYIREDNKEPIFFFNKNDHVLFPGHSKNISITFVSERPSSYYEVWELIPTEPFSENPEKLCIHLYADATQNIKNMRTMHREVKALEKVIAEQILLLAAREILEDIVTKIMCKEPEVYFYKHFLLDKDIFLMKNPIYYYHQTQVAKLEKLYSEMIPDEEWDFSVKSWRHAMMQKEYKQRMYYYDLLRESHKIMMKPWDEDEDIRVSKHRAVKRLLGQLADEMDLEYDHIYDSLVQVKAGETVVDAETIQASTVTNDSLLDINESHTLRNLFYLYVYEDLGYTIEMIAGAISGIDQDRWLDFNFCKKP